ncbi:MAG TPA: LPP20 family lipoprotein [Myxococcota bacterium]|nr:LPP20 family lipoprotein [Myxococcota bacterium]HRY94021.1 LPP20 family lipoprotein [Myxococcota bacterium]
MNRAHAASLFLVVGLVLVPFLCLAQEGGAVTDGDLKVEHGEVNWTERTITATGSGAPDLKAPNVAVARLGAERVAKLDALRNILEAVKGLQVSSDVTIENQIVTNEKMRTKIEGVARGFKVIRTKYYADGGVDLVVQMPLDGTLASSVLTPGAKTGEISASGEARNTGLIIDARGMKALPALGPKVQDESGRLVYGAELLDQASLEANGVAGYFKDLEAAKKSKRTGATPLLLKALKLAQGSKTDLVLSTADAEKLRDPKANLKYLTEGRVIIVVD